MDDLQLKSLIWHLKYGNVQERRTASYKLGKLRIPTIVPQLISAYDDKDSSVKQNVVDGLFQIGSQEALDFLNSKNIKRATVTHISARALVLLGSVMMIGSLFMPLRGKYAAHGSRVVSYGFESNLTFAALIGLLFIFVGLLWDGKPGKRYAPFAAIFPVITIINIIFVFIKVERLVIESDQTTTIGLALPLCIWGAILLFAGCLTVVNDK